MPTIPRSSVPWRFLAALCVDRPDVRVGHECLSLPHPTSSRQCHQKIQFASEFPSVECGKGGSAFVIQPKWSNYFLSRSELEGGLQ
jgi:hypothetical protein